MPAVFGRFGTLWNTSGVVIMLKIKYSPILLITGMANVLM